MSDRKWSELLDGWSAVEPSAGFADRVLARLGPPAAGRLALVAAPPPRAWRSTLLFAAVAVAALVIFPLAVHFHTPPTRAAAVAVGVVPDLGLERD